MFPNMLVSGFECCNIVNSSAILSIQDFTSAVRCTEALLSVLAEKPGNTISLYIDLFRDDAVEPDDEICLRYSYGSPDVLLCSLLDYEGISITQGFSISINRVTKKLGGIRVDGRSDNAALEEVVKIIMDYGLHIDSGIRWSAFLLQEHLRSNLDNYFSDERYMEIH